MKILLRKIRILENNPIVIWLYSSLTIILIGLFGNMFYSEVILSYIDDKKMPPTEIEMRLCECLLFFYSLFAWRLYIAGKKIFSPIKEMRKIKSPIKSKVLICNISKLNSPLESDDQGFYITFKNKSIYHLTSNIDKDIEELTIREKKDMSWNGTQLLRAVNNHKTSLDKLYLVATDNTIDPENPTKIEQVGTHIFAEKVKILFDNYLNPYGTNVINYPQLVQVADVEGTYRLYNKIIDHEINSNGYLGQDIVIDITGGTATMSVPGALSTLHHEVLFQYVSTDGTGTITQFDFGLHIPKSDN